MNSNIDWIEKLLHWRFVKTKKQIKWKLIKIVITTKFEFTSNVINNFEQIKLIKYEKFVSVVYFEKIQIYIFNYEYLNFFNEIINVVKKKLK